MLPLAFDASISGNPCLSFDSVREPTHRQSIMVSVVFPQVEGKVLILSRRFRDDDARLCLRKRPSLFTASIFALAVIDVLSALIMLFWLRGEL